MSCAEQPDQKRGIETWCCYRT